MRSQLILAMVGALISTAGWAAGAPVEFGGREHVRILGPPPIEVTARLDPAATDSRLLVTNMKYRLGADGSTWVHFTIDAGGVVTMAQVTMERLVVHDLQLRQRDGSLLHVPVIRMSLCVGNQRLQQLLQLRERHGYTAALVLGADALKNLGPVNPRAKFLHEPECTSPDTD